MSFKEIFLEDNKLGMKRLTGSLMMLNGVLGKNFLCAYALFKEVNHFNDIDNSFDTLIYGGVALLFGTIADKFFKRR